MESKEGADDNASIPASTPADGDTYKSTKVTAIHSTKHTHTTQKDLAHKISRNFGFRQFSTLSSHNRMNCVKKIVAENSNAVNYKLLIVL